MLPVLYGIMKGTANATSSQLESIRQRCSAADSSPDASGSVGPSGQDAAPQDLALLALQQEAGMDLLETLTHADSRVDGKQLVRNSTAHSSNAVC